MDEVESDDYVQTFRTTLRSPSLPLLMKGRFDCIRQVGHKNYVRASNRSWRTRLDIWILATLDRLRGTSPEECGIQFFNR